MKSIRFHTGPARVVAAPIVCAILTMVCAGIATAQSGRHLPDFTPKQPSQAPPPEKEQPAAPDQNQAKSLTPLIIMSDLDETPVMGSVQRTDTETGMLLDVVIDGCIRRLREARAFATSREGRNVNRKEASDAAKAMEKGYVALIGLGQDNMAGSTASASDLYVSFTIFSAVTGKAKSSGRVYGQSNAAGPLPLPQSGTPLEYTLRNAGRDLAERILNALNVVSPPTHF